VMPLAEWAKVAAAGVAVAGTVAVAVECFASF
jgi:hypothetical protein